MRQGFPTILRTDSKSPKITPEHALDPENRTASGHLMTRTYPVANDHFLPKSLTRLIPGRYALAREVFCRLQNSERSIGHRVHDPRER